MFQAEINKKLYTIGIEKDNTFTLNTETYDWELLKVRKDEWHAIKNGQSYRLLVKKVDYEKKQFLIQVNGRQYDVSLKDKFDMLLEKMGMSQANTNQLSDVKAPMPGLILEIKVEKGAVVKKGTPLIVLEAMKMENVIKSSGEGVVRNILAVKGDSVTKNQVLIQF